MTAISARRLPPQAFRASLRLHRQEGTSGTSYRTGRPNERRSYGLKISVEDTPVPEESDLFGLWHYQHRIIGAGRFSLA